MTDQDRIKELEQEIEVLNARLAAYQEQSDSSENLAALGIPMWKKIVFTLLFLLLGIAVYYCIKGDMIQVLRVVAAAIFGIGAVMVVIFLFSQETFLWLIGKRSEYNKLFSTYKRVSVWGMQTAIKHFPMGLSEAEKERLRGDIPLVVQMQITSRINNYIIRFFVGAFAASFALLGTIVLMNQNEKFENQNKLVYEQNTLVGNQNKLIEEQNKKFDNQNILVTDQNKLAEAQNALVTKQNTLITDQNKKFDSQNNLVKRQNELAEGQNKLVENQNILVEKQNKKFDNQNALVNQQNNLAEQQNQLVTEQNKLVGQQNELAETQNQLVTKQNKRLDQQTYLQEAERRSSLVFLFSNIMDAVNEELKEDVGKKKIRDLSPQLIGRITGLSTRLKPYRYLDGDTLIAKPLSPERGQLLVSLLGSELDTTTMNKIYDNADFSYADLKGAKLSDAYLSGTYLRGADLSDAYLRETDLSSADLSDANLSDANLIRADLRVADLSDANLIRADLIRADLRVADLIGADLRGADLSGTDLRGADLSDADLRGANLIGANLRVAYFSGADLSDANLKAAKIKRNFLQEIKNYQDKDTIIGIYYMLNNYQIDSTFENSTWEYEYYLKSKTQ